MRHLISTFFLGLATSGSFVAAQVPQQGLKMPDLPSAFSSSQPHKSVTAKSIRLTSQQSEASSDDLYGYVIYSSQRDNGMYAMTPGGEFGLLWTESYESETMHAQNGWLADGKLNMLAYQFNWGTLEAYAHVTADFETGEILTYTPLPAEMKSSYFTACAYNPNDGRIYGYGSDDYGYSSFNSASAGDITDAVAIKSTYWNEGCNAICYNSYDENLYGINGWGDFVRINAVDGYQETLFALPVDNINQAYRMGLVYLPTRNEYLWVAQFSDYTSAIYTIDTASQTCLLSAELAGSELVPFLITTDEGDMLAPANPEFISESFLEGSLSGSLTYRLPSVLAGGEMIVGDLEWQLDIDGIMYAHGGAAAATEVVVEVGALTQGIHVFALSAAKDGHTGPSTKHVAYIGNDTPKQPTGVILTEGLVEWNAVTEGVHAGWLDLNELTYEVYVNDEYIGETTDNELSFTVNSYDPYGEHVAEVIAVCNDLESVPGRSPAAIYGTPLELDVFFTPTRLEAASFKMVDAVNAGMNWMYTNDQFYMSSSFFNQTDAWLITPPIHFEDTAEVYAVDFECMLSSFQGDDTTLEVWMGTESAPECLTTVIMDAFTPSAYGYTPMRNIFSVPCAGDYYFGFRSIAAAMSSDTYLRNIAIGKAFADNNAPAAAEGIEIVAASGGELRADVSFTMPTSTVLGVGMDAGTELTAVVTSGENSVEAIGHPGQRCSVSVNTVQGNNRVSIVCYREGSAGVESFAEVFTGRDVPSTVTNIRKYVSRDNLTARFVWDAPVEGANGRYFEATGISYSVYMRRGWTTVTIAQIEDGEPLECEYSVSDGSALNNYSLTVVPSNIAGSGTSSEMYAVLGTPYQLPMNEEFTDDVLHYTPMLLSRPSQEYSGSNVYYYTPYSFNPAWGKDDHIAWIGFTSAEGGRGRLELPKFSTIGNEDLPYGNFEVWAGTDCSHASVWGITYDMEEPVLISTLQPADGWINWEFLLPECLQNKDWVQIILETEYPQTNTYLVLYTYRFDFATGVDQPGEQSGTIIGEKGAIRITGLEDNDVSIWNMAGYKVADFKKIPQEFVLPLNQGAYVVKTADKAQKVIVR